MRKVIIPNTVVGSKTKNTHRPLHLCWWTFALLVFLVISVPLGFAWSFFPIWLNRFGLVFLGVLMVTTVGEVLTIDASNPQMSLLRGSLLLAGIWVIALVVNDLRLGRNLGFLAMDLAVYLPWAALAVFLGWLSHD